MEGEDTVLLMPDDRTIMLKPIKWYKNLATRKGRLEAEAFLIEGDRTDLIPRNRSSCNVRLKTKKRSASLLRLQL